MQSDLRPAHLLDLAQHVSREPRRNLQGIYADPDTGNLVATNGHSMLVIRAAHSFTAPTLLPVPAPVIRFLKTALRD